MKKNTYVIILGVILIVSLMCIISSRIHSNYENFESSQSKTVSPVLSNAIEKTTDKIAEVIKHPAVIQSVSDIMERINEKMMDANDPDNKLLFKTMDSIKEAIQTTSPAQNKDGFTNYISDNKKKKTSPSSSMTRGRGSLDLFSDSNGNVDCIMKSSGLSNSKGGLCLSPDLIYLLQTRGGNSTTGESQIG